MQICRTYKSVEKRNGGWLIHADSADIWVIFLSETIVRVRCCFDRKIEEGSYVLMLTAWPDRMDPLFEGERVRVEPYKPEYEENTGEIIWKTTAMCLILDKINFGFRLVDSDETELYSDVPGSPFVLDSNLRITHRSKMKEDDCFYGFGEKTGILNKNKKFIRERATDAMGYDASCMDTLYKHIPFYIRLDRQSRKAVGLFYNNFYESVFNMGLEKSNYWPRYTYWQADGGDIDLFLFGGVTVKSIVDDFTALTGRPVLLPKRALGYQASSMYYPELEKDCDEAILEFVDTIKDEGFPIDGFFLSSGYTSYKNKRCGFWWNTLRFKDPGAYFERMNEKGAQNVPNIKPGMLLMHPYFKEFAEKDVFVKDSSDKSKYAVGTWWGGDGALWDFTSPRGRKAWKEYLTEFLIDVGTDSIWNDNCEYDSLLDKEAVVDYDGEGGTIGQLKPVESLLMCKIAGEAVREHNHAARPYIVCRSGCAGIQRYAQTWCGDNYTDWDTLKYDIPIITGMGLSGQPNEGADIGGFAGPAPDEELFVRWVQQGIFQARFSVHSASSDNTVTEPWMFSGAIGLIREAILLRYRMLPYLYSCEYEATLNGAPIMRALVYEFQDDPNVWDNSFDYMFGRDLLVGNVIEKGAVSRRVYLPSGADWYDINNNFRRYHGSQWLNVPVTLKTIPMFIRSGAIIPCAEDQPMNMARDRVERLHILMAPENDREFTLYEDDGVSNDYLSGVYLKTLIHVSGTSVVNVDFKPKGSYPDAVKSVTIEMIHKDRSPFWVRLGNRTITHYLNRHKFETNEEGWYYSQTKRSVLVKYQQQKGAYRLTVSFEDFDLIGM